MQLSADKMISVLIGRLFTIIFLSLSFSTALYFPPVKREDRIHFQTKPSAETRIASQCRRSVARAGRGAATTPPTATAGVCMGAGGASSPPAPGIHTARTAGTPAHSTYWKLLRMVASNTAVMLKLTRRPYFARFVWREI